MMNEKFKTYLARFSFIILLIATFFGTGIPFSERIEDVESIGSSNIINQALYGFLFLSSFFLLFTRKKELLNFVSKEKFLTMLMLWCIVSILWSPDSVVSIKRIFQILTLLLVCITFLFYVEKESEILDHFKYVIFAYLVLSIIVVVIVPQAKDPQFGTWRGFEHHKNGLGGVGVISVVISYMIMGYSNTKVKKYIAAFMMLIAIALIFGSFSSTAYTVLAVLFGLWLIFKIDKLFMPIGIGKLISVSSIVFMFALVVVLLMWIPEAKDFLPELFGKDTSYSGRTDLWEYMLDEIARHPIQGTGFQGFWIVNRLKYSEIYDIFLWLPNQAHNGYIDIVNEVGVIGLSLLLIMIGYFFYNYRNSTKPFLWILFIIIPIITNLSESSFLRPGKEMNFIFLFSYLYLFNHLLLKIKEPIKNKRTFKRSFVKYRTESSSV
jgi:O-antigen ligase